MPNGLPSNLKSLEDHNCLILTMNDIASSYYGYIFQNYASSASFNRKLEFIQSTNIPKNTSKNIIKTSKRQSGFES